MRKLFVLVMVTGLLGAGAYVRDARAGATVDLLFVKKNGGVIAPTNTVTVGTNVNVSDTLTMAVIMRNDQALTAAVYSLNYGPAGNLTVNSAFQWGGLAINAKANDFFQPLSPLQATTPTFVGSFQGLTTNVSLPRTLPPAAGAFAGGYQMGTVVWHVNAPAAATGASIISGILNQGIDAFGDAGFNDISNSVLFHSANVNPNPVPEPGTASLLGLGFAGLVLMGRRGRRA